MKYESIMSSTRANGRQALCAAVARWILMMSLVGTTIAAPAHPGLERWSSHLPGQTTPCAQPGTEAANSSAVNLRSDLSPGVWSLWLPLFCCLLLTGGLAYSIRKVHNANNQLERRTRDLSSSNEQLKREIGERWRIEQALRASENFYSSLVETVPQNIFRKDLQGHYTFANRAFCATSGKLASEIIGKTDRDLFPADAAASFQREDEQVLAAGKQLETEQNYPTPMRGRISVQMIRTPLFDAEGRPIGIQGIYWDVTDRKRAARELDSVHRQLIEASRRVGMAEVATGVLHNVGNVLNSVNVSATLVSDQVKKSKLPSLGKVASLLSENADEPRFLMDHPR